jgi:hypothetical protein
LLWPDDTSDRYEYWSDWWRIWFCSIAVGPIPSRPLLAPAFTRCPNARCFF